MIISALFLVLTLVQSNQIASSAQDSKKRKKAPTIEQTHADGREITLPGQNNKKARTENSPTLNLRMVSETVEQMQKRWTEYPDLALQYNDHKIEVTNSATPEKIFVYGHTARRCKDHNNEWVQLFSCDWKYYVSASEDKSVRIWEIATQNFRALYGFKQAVTALALNQAITTLITGCEDGLLVAWDLIDNKMYALSHKLTAQITEIEFVSDDRFNVKTADNEQTVWHIEQDNIICPALEEDHEVFEALLPHFADTPLATKEQIELYPGYWMTGTPEELWLAKEHLAEKENCPEEIAYRQKLPEPLCRAHLVYCCNQLRDPKHMVYKQEKSWGYYLNIHNCFEAIKELFLINWDKQKAEQQINTVLHIVGPFEAPYQMQLQTKLDGLRALIDSSRAVYMQALEQEKKQDAALLAERKKIDQEHVQKNREREQHKLLKRKKEEKHEELFEKKEKDNKQTDDLKNQVTQAEDNKTVRETGLEIVTDAQNQVRHYLYQISNKVFWQSLTDLERKRLVLSAFNAIESRFWLAHNVTEAREAIKDLLLILGERFREYPITQESTKAVKAHIDALNKAFGEGEQEWQAKSKLFETNLKKEYVNLMCALEQISSLLQELRKKADFEGGEIVYNKALRIAFGTYGSLGQRTGTELNNSSGMLVPAFSTNNKYLALGSAQSLPIALMSVGDFRYKTVSARVTEHDIHKNSVLIKQTIDLMRSFTEKLEAVEIFRLLRCSILSCSPAYPIILAYLNKIIESELLPVCAVPALHAQPNGASEFTSLKKYDSAVTEMVKN